MTWLRAVFLAASLIVATRAEAGIWYMAPPETISADAHRIDDTIHYTDSVIVIFFGLVVAALIYFIFRYRSRPGHQAVYAKGDKPLNIIITVLLGMTVFLSIDAVIEKMAFRDLKEVFWNFPTGADVLKVEVMPQQFAWNFRYAGPDGKFDTEDDIVPSINHMHVPVNTPVVVQMAPYDVVHSFYVPGLRIKQDATPGMVTTFWFKPVKEGVFEIGCSALCGIGHYTMKGFLTVESKEKFESWLAGLQEEAAQSDSGDFWDAEEPAADTGSTKIPADWGWPWQAKS